MKFALETIGKITSPHCGGFSARWLAPWFILILLQSAAASETEPIESGIADLGDQMERLESEMSLARQDLLLKQQTLAQLNGYVAEIEEAYPPPRSEEIEKSVWEFERMRETAQGDVDYFKGVLKDLEKGRDRISEQLAELNRELVRAELPAVALHVEDLETETDEGSSSGSDDAIVDLNKIIMQSRRDLDRLTKEVYSQSGETSKFIAKAEKLRLEAQQKNDIIYEQMYARYLGLKGRGVAFISPPLKPEGYDQRLALRKTSGAAGNRVSPSRLPPVNAGGGRGSPGGTGSAPLSQIEQLRIAIANTTDPQQKANLEEQLRMLEGAQK